MPKPTTNTDTETPDIPFFYVRVAPTLLAKVEAKRLELGYNKRKSVEVMSELFLAWQPGAVMLTAPMPKKKKTKTKPTPKR